MPTLARHLLWEETFPQDIERTMRQALAGVEPSSLRRVLEEASRGGKRIRPMLTALACAAAGGNERNTLIAGSALELLHTSSLVHDDIMDEAAMRRGIPTVVRKHGTSMAVLAGDALMALAFRLIQRCESPRKDKIMDVFTTTFLDLCEGQCADIQNTATLADETASHRWMVERKTARLVEACTTIGALLASDDATTIGALGRFGFCLGLAYQASDDLLDAVGDEVEAGKTLRIDARNGRSTFLTLAYPETDTVEHIRRAVAAHTEEACAALEVLPPSPAREQLRDLAQGLLERRR